MPENIKEGRMGNFLDNVIDWGLSRERYWGTPLPVWVCKCGHTHIVGSIEEPRRLGRMEDGSERAGGHRAAPALHRPGGHDLPRNAASEMRRGPPR